MVAKIKLRFKILLVLLALSLLLKPATAYGQPQRQVILLMADYLTLADLQSSEAPFLQELSLSGAVGLMNTNTAMSLRTSPHTHATISAGKPSQGGTNNVLASRTQDAVDGELACVLFQRYTGNRSGKEEVVILNWPQILRANQDQGRGNTPLPGSLGSLLKEAGLSVAVFGNSDAPNAPHRPAVLITSDLNGITATGEVGEGILRPADGLLPWRTDYTKLLTETKELMPSTDFVVVDFGDLSRLEVMQRYALEEVIQKERKSIIKDINDFCQVIFSQADPEKTIFILLSTTPSNAQVHTKNFLVPILIAGGKMESGLLFSNTTRRAGLVTNTDLTASILEFLNVTPSPQMTGQAVVGKVLKEDNPLSYLAGLNERLVFTYQIRPLIIKPYVGLQIATILLSVPLFFALRRLIPYYRYWLSLLVAFPGALLFAGIFTQRDLATYVIVSIALTFLQVSLSYRYTAVATITPFVFLSTLIAGFLMFDLKTGSSLMQQSLLGYDPIAGARYYGIGNEYMGVLIGSSFLGMGVILQTKNKPFLAVLFFGLLIWLMLAAHYGANFGGTIAAFVAFAYWFWRWQKDSLKKHLIFWAPFIMAFMVIVVIGGLGFIDNTPSHIGRTVQLVRKEGIEELIDIIIRKGQLNLKLIRYTPWSKVFLLALLAMGVLFFKPTDFFQQLYRQHRPVYEAFLAILVGSITALIWNDSGIVAAATTMIYGVYPILSIALDENFLAS